MTLIEKGIDANLIRYDAENRFITYLHQNKRRSWANPEEKVQAETFLKLVLSYQYPVQRIKLYIPVTMGSSVKEADIILYYDDDCTSPYIIVECKKEEISEQEFIQSIEQAFTYAYATPRDIKYIWVTSGIKDQYFEFDKNSELRKTIPDIPAFGVNKLSKYKYVYSGDNVVLEQGFQDGQQKYFDLEVVTEEEITRRFKQAHNTLWAGGEMNPSQAFDELDKLIFCKIWDELKTVDEEDNRFRSRKPGEPYLFQTFAEETEEQLAKRIRQIYEQGRKVDPEVFTDDIRLSSLKIKSVVGYLEGINLSKTDLDSKGRAFEAFMGSYFRGDFGQYFTPRPIVKFIIETLPIRNDSRVLDTSCGSGGFLLYALDKIREEAGKYYKAENVQHYKYWHDFAQFNLFGIEINESIARTAKMNMIIHDDGHTNVIAADGLINADAITMKTGNTGFKFNTFDFIVTNPPFGSTIKQNEKAYLHQYQFGISDTDWLDIKNSVVKNRSSQSTEVLFIEQCRNYLKPNGYLAIVIPDGVLTNSSMQYVRDQIEDWYRIVAVVSLPQTAFMHTGAGVKSSVLFFRKYPTTKQEAISARKNSIREKIKMSARYNETISELETERNDIVKNLKGFKNHTGVNQLKAIVQTEDFKIWKNQIFSEYAQKINELKDRLNDEYLERKQKELDDYQIFMAIAGDIGYDATGRQTGKNDLIEIGKELARFIQHINKTEK